MQSFITNGKDSKYSLFFPTSLSEISTNYLNTITSSVDVGNYKCLVALCYREKLSSVIMTYRQRKDRIDNASVVTLLAKHGNHYDDNSFVKNISVGSKLIISPSQLAMGNHVYIPNNYITVSNLIKHIEEDKEAYTNALKLNEPVYFTEFKIINEVDIVGAYNDDIKADNIFAPVIIKGEDND